MIIMTLFLMSILAQLVDNLIFALLVGYFFFGWSFIECLSSSVIGMLVELLVQTVFTPLGNALFKKIETKELVEELDV